MVIILCKKSAYVLFIQFTLFIQILWEASQYTFDIEGNKN